MGDRSSKQSDLPATAAALMAGVRLTARMLIMLQSVALRICATRRCRSNSASVLSASC